MNVNLVQQHSAIEHAYKLAAAATLLDMSVRSVERHVARGRIRVIRIGRTVRVPESEIRRILSQGAE